MMTLHLFAGAGGGILADLILGHEPVSAVEIDPYACSILRERFPWMHVIEGDVRSVDFSAMVGIDAICAGFPCQDISAAGKGVGITGERSGLFREVMRAVDTIRPDWIFLENSPRIRTRGRRVVIGELVARGYSWRDGVLGAADVGALHQRDRWWCLAANADGLRKLQQKRREQDELGRAGNGIEEVTPNSCRDGSQVSVLHGRIPESEIETIKAAERYTGTRYWNKDHSDICGMVHGVANRAHRIRCLGNGHVPLCAAAAWRLLAGP